MFRLGLFCRKRWILRGQVLLPNFHHQLLVLFQPTAGPNNVRFVSVGVQLMPHHMASYNEPVEHKHYNLEQSVHAQQLYRVRVKPLLQHVVRKASRNVYPWPPV